MAEVKVLVEGVHKFTSEDALDIGCTTTLIKSDINIIVDPGSFVNKEKLISALKEEGLGPEDIGAVILTHLHLDHTANVPLFKDSTIFLRFRGGSKYPGMFQKINEGTLQRFDLLNKSIAKDVKIIETLGHSIDGISVIVDTDKGKVVIAGDAISSEAWTDLNKEPESMFVYDTEKFKESRKRILDIADYIIPGHGKMFKVKK
ncbi:Hydroxyacylglutathione hydrolase [uncultured archaeon]|nr:Hydroxyacylglutathione hydrolase [uncultured archaeon]